VLPNTQYEDLSQLEQQFIAASQANERRAALIRRLVIAAAVLRVAIIVALIIAGLVVQKREAVANSQLMQHQVAKTLVERAAVLMRDGDVSGSLLWLAQALLEDREAQYDEKIHRIRLSAAIAQLPKLHHALLEERSTYLCNSAKFNADGSLVLTVSNPKQAGEGVVRLWDSATGKKLADFDAKAKVNDAGFCADGRIIIATGDPGLGPGQVRLWQKDGQSSTEFVVSKRAVLSATMSPEGNRVALLFEGNGDQPAVLEVRRISDRMSLTGPLEWPGESHDVKFSPEGNYVAAGGAIKELLPGLPPKNTGQVKVWNAWTGEPLNLDVRSDLPSIAWRSLRMTPEKSRRMGKTVLRLAPANSAAGVARWTSGGYSLARSSTPRTALRLPIGSSPRSTKAW
jgi:WD40 repeat protein